MFPIPACKARQEGHPESATGSTSRRGVRHWLHGTCDDCATESRWPDTSYQGTCWGRGSLHPYRGRYGCLRFHTVWEHLPQIMAWEGPEGIYNQVTNLLKRAHSSSGQYRCASGLRGPNAFGCGDGPTLLGRNWLSQLKLNWEKIHQVSSPSLCALLSRPVGSFLEQVRPTTS